MGPPPPRNPEGWKGAGDTGKLARSASGKTDALPRLARVAVDCSALQKEVNSLQDHLCQSSASGKGAMDFALLQVSRWPLSMDCPSCVCWWLWRHLAAHSIWSVLTSHSLHTIGNGYRTPSRLCSTPAPTTSSIQPYSRLLVGSCT